MKPKLTTVRARFDGKELVVIDHSPELPETYDPLLLYLEKLSLSGWKAVRGKFDGWEVTLSMEQQAGTPYKESTYLIPILHQIPVQGGRSGTAAQHDLLMNALQKGGMKDGWIILAGPQQFSIGPQFWTISIWLKN